MKTLLLTLAFGVTATAAFADGELTCFYNTGGEFTYTAEGPSAPDGTFDFAYSFILPAGAWYDEAACPLAIDIPPLVAPGPNLGLEPAYGTIELAAGFLPDPHQVEILAGGVFDASATIDSACRGWIAEAPDYRLNFTASTNPLLTISATSTDAATNVSNDTTLVINDPQGNWHCNDDSEGLNPAVAFDQPLSGQYDIWIGTYSEGDFFQSTLSISEF